MNAAVNANRKFVEMPDDIILNGPFLTRSMLERINVVFLPSGPDPMSLPFALNDTTAGSESELQAAVIGKRDDVDLPIIIQQSNYLANIVRRTAAGDTTRHTITELETFLRSNVEQVWENSWVRLPVKTLKPFAGRMLKRHLLADQRNPGGGQRSDIDKFLFHCGGEQYVRIPISYMMRLSLADILDSLKNIPPPLYRKGIELMDHFLNDNTSPETHSFHVVQLHPATGMGKTLAGETVLRFLMTHLLVTYANINFSLLETGQKALVFFSPHPPVRQKILNSCISDSFYRELFMNPCLSGWNNGEVKQEYMHLCHRVLSLSQLNAFAKLKEAGIITSNLISLPNTSNISLANNGTHVSLGSRRLSMALEDPSSGFTRHHEKYLGDLVIKIVEHFLPLFVGTYSAAPYRLGFLDFHPEKALGFLPHELDYTHLRMLWRRWQKKAKLKIFGQPVTPFGPSGIDRLMSALFGLDGDYVTDFRLIDYLVCLMSTEQSPALNGRMNNHDRLRKDLSDLGIFDTKMSLYLLDKLREYHVMGFSGFEGRYYSLFENIREDMGRAVELQNLLYLLAFKLIASGRVSHLHIPDNPFIESERRQIIFGTAIGIPTFFAHQKTENAFLRQIVQKSAGTRSSHRYPGYWRVYNLEYRRALVRFLREEGADLIDMLGLQEMVTDLSLRIEDPLQYSAFGKLTRHIMKDTGGRKPMKVDAPAFNQAAERFYRTRLKHQHLREALDYLENVIRRLDRLTGKDRDIFRLTMRRLLGECSLGDFLETAREEILTDQTTVETIRTLAGLILLQVYCEEQKTELSTKSDGYYHVRDTSVH